VPAARRSASPMPTRSSPAPRALPAMCANRWLA
jgi:hypothetical protein